MIGGAFALLSSALLHSSWNAIRRAGTSRTGSLLRGLAESGAGVALTLRNTAVVCAQLLALAMCERAPHRQFLGALLVAGGAADVAWR